MSKIVVLGAGISGHTAAAHLRRKLSKEHEVLVVSPNRNYQWVPSNIWVGIGRMKSKEVIFPLEPLYKRKGIGYKQEKSQSCNLDSTRKCVESKIIQVILPWNRCLDTCS